MNIITKDEICKHHRCSKNCFLCKSKVISKFPLSKDMQNYLTTFLFHDICIDFHFVSQTHNNDIKKYLSYKSVDSRRDSNKLFISESDEFIFGFLSGIVELYSIGWSECYAETYGKRVWYDLNSPELKHKSYYYTILRSTSDDEINNIFLVEMLTNLSQDIKQVPI